MNHLLLELESSSGNNNNERCGNNLPHVLNYTLCIESLVLWDSLNLYFTDELSFSVINCEDPGTPLGGRKTGTNFTYKSNVTFQCDPGYDISMNVTMMCDEQGKWTDTLPTCNSKNHSSLTIFVYDFDWNNSYELEGHKDTVQEVDILQSEVIFSLGKLWY